MDDTKIRRHRPDVIPAELTTLVLDNDKPHFSEAGEQGYIEIDRWEAVRDGSMEIHVSSPFEPGNNTKKRLVRVYTVKAGDVINVPRVYRDAIQTVRDNVIVGGLGIHLKRLGDGPRLQLAECFGEGPPPAPPLPVSTPGAAQAEARALERARARRGVTT